VLMAKVDIKHAYKKLQVHVNDRGLLGMQWQWQLLVDGCLPFGMRSASLLYKVAAHLLQWVMCKRRVTWIWHYIDDFITLDARGNEECKHNFGLLKQVCKEASIPTDAEKDESPVTELVYLCMKLNSEKLEIRLPQE